METRAQSDGGEVLLLPPGGHAATDDESSETQAPPVLALHQISAAHLSNEYSQGPVGLGRPLADGTTARDQALVSSSVGTAHTWPLSTVSRSTSGTSNASRSTARISTDSASSDLRLLGNVGRTSGRHVVRVQPKRSEVTQEVLKPLRATSDEENGTGGGVEGKHSHRCKRCGRCRCAECAEPRPLPSCWLCARRCVCSPESAVDHATCVCCLKALFYHCSSDDEDECADKPFSCRQPLCCVRWGTAGALTLLLPCLLCYLPARGCLALCHACYDRAKRPGCRCHSARLTHCKNVDV
ncbi:protein sprouty homolog 2 [Electrophorus electricus]|uniref:Protein sprouty homolog 2 n=1 Tax=Electrophorus electricus TaxID=8005 RepID=A0A4W4GFQ5_ELEEL|nr:protein sprouty homolog 2 [Electrophorus electricus]